NIMAEDNPLHIVALKADGAMRDALSIFDQLVSFAGDKLTYETVLENLNVLDYEYFFKITDLILQGDIPGTLLTVNDILDKGFDGQHFLIGFGEHLRNLMVCKDPATARLLETAPSIRSHYLEQSVHCPAGFLLKVLDIGNRCDLNYKTSNNKRLHLELSLMQMCALIQQNQQFQVNNRSPVVSLKGASTTGNPQPKTVNNPSPVPTVIVQGQPDIQHPASVVQPASGHPPLGTVKMKDIQKEFTSSLSIKKPIKKEEELEAGHEESARNQTADPFTQTDLSLIWDEYAEKLKSDSPHLYSTLRKFRPMLLPEWQIEFTLDNKILEDELNLKKGELMEFLRTKLNNCKIQLFTKVAENQKELKPYTDKEKFGKMAEKNPALRKLREELDLEIEY
ncbi:MAG: hypothetical protein WCI71_18410, partial [Bacteroidota bacterium]